MIYKIELVAPSKVARTCVRRTMDAPDVVPGDHRLTQQSFENQYRIAAVDMRVTLGAAVYELTGAQCQHGLSPT